MDIPYAVAKRILEKTGLRVSKTAVEEFRSLIEEIITDISAEAVSLAKLAGRKTVLLEDIKQIRKKLR